ncbi:MAG: hypothetical protein Q4C75_04905 [Bergeyella zoohelcum]|nr:hypothetical protein [Bergeyella zoohelcum]
MNTAIISAEIKTSDIPLLESLLKRMKAKSIEIKEKDDAKMSKKAFFAKIDKARESKKTRMSLEEMNNYLDRQLQAL